MKTTLLSFLILISFIASAQNLEDFFKSTDVFLKAHVQDGTVNYKSIAGNPSELNAILKNAEHLTISTEDANTYKAFWINAYNLLVIKAIINNYPLKSPLDVKGFFNKKEHAIGGGHYSLNTIENKLLRGNFKDPRIHFVLVCGAKGCPPIISDSYAPEKLETQLTEQTKKAINGSFIQINSAKKIVLVSQIMEWYKEDFVRHGSEIDFLNLYLEQPIPTDYKLGYIAYDWSLNER